MIHLRSIADAPRHPNASVRLSQKKYEQTHDALRAEVKGSHPPKE
jgi:hypothetical protein